MKEMVLENRRVTTFIKGIADDMGVSFGSVHTILNDISDMRRVSARHVHITEIIPKMNCHYSFDIENVILFIIAKK